MTMPLRHRFSALPAGPGWLARGWPRSVGVMQSIAFSGRYSRRDLLALCAWAGLRGSRGRGGFGVPAVSSLAAIASRNGRSNHYHQSGHFAHVVMAAAVLGEKAGIDNAERALLVLAALVHDLDHQGRRGAHHPLYRQERLSAQMAGRVLMRHGGDPRLVRRLERLIVATALTTDTHRNAILASDPLARLLSDADVFASLCYERALALKLTVRLKLEQGITADAEAMLDGFAARMEAEGMASDAGRSLLRDLAASRQPHRNVVTGKGWK